MDCPETLLPRVQNDNHGHAQMPSPRKERPMSAPQTNLETQQRRHRGPIIGMIAVVIFALGLLFVLFMNTARDGTPTDSGAPQIDGRTGLPTAPDPTAPGAPVDDPAIPAGDPPLAPEGDLPPVDPPSPGPDLPEQPLPGTGAPTP